MHLFRKVCLIYQHPTVERDDDDDDDDDDDENVDDDIVEFRFYGMYQPSKEIK